MAKGSFGDLRLIRRLTEVPAFEERLSALERKELVQALEQSLLPYDPAPRGLTSLRLLGMEGTACVVTGQQAGLCGGPLYTLIKAMQACRLATELSASSGRPVVPVFWNHGDDHDWGEVSHLWIKNRNEDLVKLSLAGARPGRWPIQAIALCDEQHGLPALRATLAQAFEEFPGSAEALELLFPRPGESLVRALTRALVRLLSPHGLVVLEPSALRPALARALARVVSADPVRFLRPGPIEVDRAALLFHIEEGQRQALRPADTGFVQDGRSGRYESAELAACILERPADFSAGALLRPLVQDLVLPSIATVGGWGEFAYHAQTPALRQALGLPPSNFVARVSLTLVDSDLRLALLRLRTTEREVLASGGAWRPSGAQDQPPVVERLREREALFRRELLALRQEVHDLEPALEASLRRTADIVKKEVGKLREKVERVAHNRRGTGERQIRKLNHGLLPRGIPQDRVLCTYQFLATAGLSLVDALYEELPALSIEPLLVDLSSTKTPAL